MSEHRELTGLPDRLRLSDKKLSELLNRFRTEITDSLKVPEEKMDKKLKLIYDFLKQVPEGGSVQEHLKTHPLVKERFNDKRVLIIIEKISEFWEQNPSVSVEEFIEEVKKLL